jgi:DNA processing protein
MWRADADRNDGPKAESQILDLDDSDYPARLRLIRKAPGTLYVAGLLLPSDSRAIAIVGSRQADARAVSEATQLARSLAALGVTIVSGLALGIDTAAHRGALSAADGRTIAVVASGLDMTFPSENRALDLLIRRRGAVVSQLPLGTRPSRETFLARNEIIAGLSAASVIVAAAERSGTRNEMSHTLEQGKPVVFWGPTMSGITWARQLVREGAGLFAESVEDLVQRLGGLTLDIVQG